VPRTSARVGACSPFQFFDRYRKYMRNLLAILSLATLLTLAFQSPAQAQVPPGGRTPKVLSLLPASVVAGQISGLLRVSITGTGFGPYMTARVSYAASLNSATIVSADVQVQHDGPTQATLTLSPAMLAHPQQLTIVLTDPAREPASAPLPKELSAISPARGTVQRRCVSIWEI
jgi:hypothetical protein